MAARRAAAAVIRRHGGGRDSGGGMNMRNFTRIQHGADAAGEKELECWTLEIDAVYEDHLYRRGANLSLNHVAASQNDSKFLEK